MKKNVVITLSENSINRLKSIAELLKSKGLVINNMYEFGVITGIIEESKISGLLEQKEIESLTEEQIVKISPPDSDIQ